MAGHGEQHGLVVKADSMHIGSLGSIPGAGKENKNGSWPMVDV